MKVQEIERMRQHWRDSKAVAITFWCICISHGAWRQLKKYCTNKDIVNYPDGCITCLKSFSVGFASPMNKFTKIMKMKGNETQRERNKCMVCSIQVIFIFYLDWSLNLCSFYVHHIVFFQEAGDTCPSIQVSKAIVFEDPLLSHWLFSIFILSKQQDRLSHLNISMLIDNNPMEQYRAVL